MAPITRLLSVPAVLALVAGVGLAASVPASAKLNTKSSATTIVIDQAVVSGLESQGIVISAKGGATWTSTKGEVRFPVSKVTATAVNHRGTLVFTKGSTVIEVVEPVILTPEGAAEFIVTAKTPLGPNTPLFVLKRLSAAESCSVQGSRSKWIKRNTIRLQSEVSLTSDPSVIGALQVALSPLFTPDLQLGPGRVTLVDDINSKTKPKC